MKWPCREPTVSRYRAWQWEGTWARAAAGTKDTHYSQECWNCTGSFTNVLLRKNWLGAGRRPGRNQMQLWDGELGIQMLFRVVVGMVT